MKSLIRIFACLLMPYTAMSQQPEPAIARVSYTYSHIRDTTQRERPYNENMILIIGKNASLYSSADKIAQTERLTNFVKQQTQANGGTLSNLVMQKGMFQTVTSSDLYFYAKEKKMLFIEYAMMTKYQIEEDAPPINWKINKDTASFFGIHCQQATTYFKGRNWIAWFAPDMPFPSGPWKLNSLPGLIIEAYDERKDIHFSLVGLEKVTDKNVENKVDILKIGTSVIPTEREIYMGSEIKIPTNAVKTNREEITRLRKAITENPAAAINSQSTIATVKRVSPATTQTTTNKASAYNNPIELPEQKSKP